MYSGSFVTLFQRALIGQEYTMADLSDEYNHQILDFGKDFDVDLRNIYAARVCKAFPEVIAVQLDTTPIDALVLILPTFYACRYDINIIVLLFNVLNKLNVCLPRSSVVVGPRDERTGQLAANAGCWYAACSLTSRFKRIKQLENLCQIICQSELPSFCDREGSGEHIPYKNCEGFTDQHCRCFQSDWIHRQTFVSSNAANSPLGDLCSLLYNFIWFSEWLSLFEINNGSSKFIGASGHDRRIE